VTEAAATAVRYGPERFSIPAQNSGWLLWKDPVIEPFVFEFYQNNAVSAKAASCSSEHLFT
jgi:hypothetical protein